MLTFDLGLSVFSALFTSYIVIGVTLWSSKRHPPARWPPKSSALADSVIAGIYFQTASVGNYAMKT